MFRHCGDPGGGPRKDAGRPDDAWDFAPTSGPIGRLLQSAESTADTTAHGVKTLEQSTGSPEHGPKSGV